MSLEEKKEILLQIVEDADEKLLRLMTAVAHEYNDSHVEFTEEELHFFEERRLEFFNSGKIGSSVEEVHSRIRSNYKNGL